MAQNPLEKVTRIGSSAGAAGYGRYAGLGVQFAATIGAFAWLGWYLDGRLGSSPWLLIAGVMLGFFGALVSLVRKVPPARGHGPPRADDPSDSSSTSS